ncbi:MAG: hypothetical protein GOMPHAMPRED_007461 [Gomphillus americanus]|uniref:SPX domain-containing protein n=1 Tax=Gomphillus americanus TaxID=1940652 RepID=A0A8H3ERU3_9LECA|nr:MAG: hypothetical protein GOMPHAMPRED_007461 [Gomphillus americanus]
MRFGKSLTKAQYGPWKQHYLDYNKLKSLLREDDPDKPWVDEDEQRFVDELVNVQLEKVNSFQTATYKSLIERTSQCESKLEKLVGKDEASKDKESELSSSLKELDSIREEINRLERFSRINYTGALKAAKKHDRRRGANYKVRPLLQVRLASMPFTSEDYSPLLYRLSAMYAFIRQQLDGNQERAMSNGETHQRMIKYTSYKFFVHPENLLELKTSILRHLPVLVYTPTSTKAVDAVQKDPTITSLYFDNKNFSLYTGKVEKGSGAASLRLRWYGQLRDRPELALEKKTLAEGDDSEEIRFNIKAKYVLPFLKGEYKMEKQTAKLRQKHGANSEEVQNLEKTVDEIQDFVKTDNLEPILRASYTRTAFQIPGDNKVRISLDTNMAFIREDCLDVDRPVRDPDQWHRTDIDDAGMEYPYSGIRKGEISKFPYALLEIKVREGSSRRHSEWIDDIMSSHLVCEAPRFSKFVHGVASLFEDHINTLPFWMSLLETDIRKDPEQAFEEEQEKKNKRAEDELAIGSFIGSFGKSPLNGGGSQMSKKQSIGQNGKFPASKMLSPVQKPKESEDGSEAQNLGVSSRLKQFFPAFSSSKYAQSKRNKVQLPPGVKKPEYWIKDVGTVKVEPKVWLANQRTFIKWCHIAILLSTLSVSLYNSAGLHSNVARGLAVVYTIIAIFAGAWGYGLYISRSRMIRRRSGEDLDNILGPTIVCLGLSVALCLNFGFKVS